MKILEDIFEVGKPIIAMAHFPPLPGSPLYEPDKGLQYIKEWVISDVQSLIEGKVDAIMFCNEGDRPYLMEVEPVTLATMARVITEVKEEFGSSLPPFGTDILWSPKGAIALGKAVEARFVREVFTGAYGGETGIWDTTCGDVLRYKKLIDADDLFLLYNINAEYAGPLAERPLEDTARTAVFASLADIICVSGPMTGMSPGIEDLKNIKEAVPHTPVFANTGITRENVADILPVVDGVVIGTSLKEEEDTWNPVDRKRVSKFMKIVKDLR